MKREAFFGGNWKMNLITLEAVELAKNLRMRLEDIKDAEIVVAPVYTVLSAVREVLIGSNIGLAGQDLFWEKSGAFTGAISAQMLKDVGCGYVIVGHSERRQYFFETDEWVNKKIKTAIEEGLVPIFCVGETLAERDCGKTLEVVSRQTKKGLEGLSKEDAKKIVVAYEPVWAIGTGRTATPAQAEEVHLAIRRVLSEIYDDELSDMVRIIYGGSVKPDNIEELMRMPNIDGALVGGASLKPESFSAIVRNALKVIG